MLIRTAKLSDLDEISRVESACFPESEAATRESFAQRLKFFANHFWLMFNDDNKLISFVDGFVTNERNLNDSMYSHAEFHDENGKWQMIFGVNTLPEYRNKGYAGKLIQRAINDAKSQNRLGLVLTCKNRLVKYYAKFGFINEGKSTSTHGGVEWNQMRLTF
ncbi:MAG: GNAT family N-acetyltransferase [Synergistaceae bacterium]|nr:GNAT family N-acetyltransferase [Synergistaceae bacterium]